MAFVRETINLKTQLRLTSVIAEVGYIAPRSTYWIVDRERNYALVPIKENLSDGLKIMDQNFFLLYDNAVLILYPSKQLGLGFMDWFVALPEYLYDHAERIKDVAFSAISVYFRESNLPPIENKNIRIVPLSMIEKREKPLPEKENVFLNKKCPECGRHGITAFTLFLSTKRYSQYVQCKYCEKKFSLNSGFAIVIPLVILFVVMILLAVFASKTPVLMFFIIIIGLAVLFLGDYFSPVRNIDHSKTIFK